MFVVRSAFWLVVGFALVAPHGTNFGAAAAAVEDQAISAGIQASAQIVASQTLSNPVLSRLIASAKPSTPSVDLPMQDSPTKPFVFPRPRPAAMG
jgi:hypothetical protein